MSNLEHLIENTLMIIEDNTLCNKDIREHIKNDVNFSCTSLSVDDVLEICTYFMYTWCGTCEKCNGR